ncbi:MAG TPA: DHH family phosphoesterase [Chloroflexota bacterium]|nr:DHH family phosphoesterase [Chloroflexota bacterium]
MEPRYTPVLLPLLKTVRKVVVSCHADPDGDAVAGMLALSRSLKKARWDVRLISPGPVPRAYRFLPGWEDVEVYRQERIEMPDGIAVRDAFRGAEAIICLDCSDLSRLGPLYSGNTRKFESTPVVNIDHHPTNSRFGRVNLVDTSAAATCEILSVLMENEDLPVDEEVATSLMMGILTDTLGFRTPATSARTLRVAAALMERGASLSRISERIFNSRSPRTLQLWGRVLSRTQVDGRLVWSEITSEMLAECGATLEDADMLVDFIAGVPQTDAAFLFSEQGGMVRVSMRTSEALNAATVAKRFGGGGHARAAGCTLEGSMSDVETRLMNEARERLGMAAEGDR